MNDDEVPAPPSSAGICGKSLLVSSVPTSPSIPAMAESAAAGAVLTLASSLPGVCAGGFCADGFCPAEKICNPATIHPRIKQYRILIAAPMGQPRYRQLAGGCFAPDSCP